jgi:hypothetical protein
MPARIDLIMLRFSKLACCLCDACRIPDKAVGGIAAIVGRCMASSIAEACAFAGDARRQIICGR